MPMAVHVAADHGSVEHVHRRKQRLRAIALVIMSHRSRSPLLHRQAGLGSVERLDLAFLVDGKDNSVRLRIDIEPDHVAQLVNEREVIGELELPDAVWLKSVERQMRCTDETLMPAASAIAAPVQCVASATGGSIVSVTTRSATARSSFRMREGLVLSRSNPSKPSSAKRSRQRQTQVLDLFVSRMIALVPISFAVSKTIRARQTCFFGAFRLPTSACSRCQPAHAADASSHPQTRTPQVRSESLITLKCQI